MDFIGQINAPSTKGHRFVLVATDYFTKWTEAVPLKNMTHREVIEFIAEHIIHGFGIPQTLTTDQGTGICRILQNKDTQFISILCSGQWSGRIY